MAVLSADALRLSVLRDISTRCVEWISEVHPPTSTPQRRMRSRLSALRDIAARCVGWISEAHPPGIPLPTSTQPSFLDQVINAAAILGARIGVEAVERTVHHLPVAAAN